MTTVVFAENTLRRSRYLVLIAPECETTEVRCRQLETESDLAIGNALFLDERLMCVSAIGDGHDEYDATVVVSGGGG